MNDQSCEAERLVRCFDPDASLAEGKAEHLVISPRWGRLRRGHPLLGSAPHAHGVPVAWLAARETLLGSRDRSVQVAITKYEHRIRMQAAFSLQQLLDTRFDLHAWCHDSLERWGRERQAAMMRREAFWIRSTTPTPDGRVQFEFGNIFLLPIAESALLAEGKTLL